MTRTQESDIALAARAVDFGYGTTRVLHDVSLDVHPGDRLGIVGESGSGKTTLARLLVGAIDAHGADVTVNGAPWSKVSRRSRLRRGVQMIHQDPFASLNPHLSAHSAVREAAMVCQGLSARKAGALADELLESVGVNQRMAARKARQLSGGQCQRVAIARALAANPAIIVADEPTSALDLSVQAQIMNVLLDVMDERETALVIVSHDLAVVRHLTEDVVVMRYGRIVERGRTDEVLTNPVHPYTQSLCRAA